MATWPGTTTLTDGAGVAARLFPCTSGGSDKAEIAGGLLRGLRGHIDGLTLSNNVSDATNDIDIAAGEATSTGGWLITLAAGLTKRLDATWAVGTNQGGLDTGAKANSTWYHLHLIQRSDTGVVDVLFSTSATAPTMPTSYDRRRRVGSVLTSGAGAILAFRQNGNLVNWATPVENLNTASPATSSTLLTVTSPPAVRCEVRLWTQVAAGAAATKTVRVGPGDGTAADANIEAITAPTSGAIAAAAGRTLTDASSRVTYSAASAASVTVLVYTTGYTDPRGRE